VKKQILINYEQCDLTALNEMDLTLVNKAKEACENAYAPYSKFMVGASIMLESGKIIVGNNQENIAYPSGLCAERVALFTASSNFPNQKIISIAVFAQSKTFDFKEIVKPCGACRQVLLEYETKQNQDIRVLLAGREEAIIVTKANDLLPFIFQATGLKI